MKYCIGCIHFYYRPHDPGRMRSEWTWRYGEQEAELLCKQGHWRMGMESGNEFPIGENMTRANTCADYEERTHESIS